MPLHSGIVIKEPVFSDFCTNVCLMIGDWHNRSDESWQYKKPDFNLIALGEDQRKKLATGEMSQAITPFHF